VTGPAPASAPSLRVALDARYLHGPRGGIRSTVENLLVEMTRQEPGLELLLVVRRDRELPDLPGVRYSEAVFDSDPTSLSSVLGFAWRVPLDGWPLLHTPYNFLPRGVRIPSIVTVHDVMWLQDPRNIALHPAKRIPVALFYRAFLPDGARRATHLIAVSRATADALISFVPDVRGKVTVIPNGLDPAFGPIPADEARRLTESIVPGDRELILCVGNASPHKNHLRAVKAFMQAFGDREDYRLVLVRRFERWDPEITRLLARPEVQHRVVVLPEVSSEVLRALYCRARVYFFPSWVEGFGLPLLEAMACRCPIVTSDRSALIEVAGDAALTVDPFDVDALARALTRAASDEGLRADLVARGLERFPRFSWKDSAAQTLQLYREVIRRA
jgi:glycosyltransferase involved in cell wall biosynthesis